MLARLLDLLVLGQAVGMRRAHAARRLLFLAQDFAGTDRRTFVSMTATLRFWAAEKPGHRARVRLGQVCQDERSHLSTLLSSSSFSSQAEPTEITTVVS